MKQFGLVALVCVIIYTIVDSRSVTEYIASRKTRMVSTNTISQWQKEMSEAGKANIPPVDAKIDPIWKAIPGYNGLVMDEQATASNMLTAGKWDPRLIVYKEVPPQVQLDQLKTAPIYRGNPNKPMVSLMINVAWGNEYLPSILDTLKKEGVKATFFLDGSWTNKYPDEAKKIAEAGHEIGSHAYSHPDMSKLSLVRIEQEITRTNEAIQQATGVTPTLFAPPSGDFDDRVVKAAGRFRLKTILWTADTVDWRKPTPDVWFRQVAPKVSNGVLILMHPTKPTAETLPRLIEYIKGKKLAIGTVSETLSSKRVSIE
ncbi:polysaccharide deacetylase family protein [Aneurinibacillus terranovensis]|uniref:polysaccharide deacetylase family protein n=1 Tax=Aneurinibacillus terranovensis TaxID=278991 RepID=UPI00041177D0|nr:polysaccharide deacetylase family protein [Aneurinibacillus terranovensis]